MTADQTPLSSEEVACEREHVGDYVDGHLWHLLPQHDHVANVPATHHGIILFAGHGPVFLDDGMAAEDIAELFVGAERAVVASRLRYWADALSDRPSPSSKDGGEG